MMASRGYDMTPTMYSPDGRIYQVEYAIETVKRGTLAIGISTKQGVIMAVEEKARTLQTKILHRNFPSRLSYWSCSSRIYSRCPSSS